MLNPPKTTYVYDFEIPTCACVIAARALDTVFGIPEKYDFIAESCGNGTSFSLYFVTVKCSYCGSAVLYKDGCELKKVVAS